MDWPFTFAVQMIDIPANKPITCMALKMCLAIMVLSPKSIVLRLRSSHQKHVAVALQLVKKPLNQVVRESLCLSPGSLLIPDDLDSTRCQQSRFEDLEYLQGATKSSNRLLGDRIRRAE